MAPTTHSPTAPWPRWPLEAREPVLYSSHSHPTKHPKSERQAQDTQEVPKGVGTGVEVPGKDLPSSSWTSGEVRVWQKRVPGWRHWN